MLKFTVDDGIQMRILEKVDAVPLFNLIEKNRTYLKKWIPWLNETQSLRQTAHYIEQGKLQFYSNRSFQAGIWQEDVLVGCAGFHPIDWRHHRTSLGYWIGEEFQGKGIISKSVICLLKHAFEELELNRVEIRCGTDNVRSQAIPMKLGFEQEGIVRSVEWLYDHYVDHVVFGMLKEEWNLHKVKFTTAGQGSA